MLLQRTSADALETAGTFALHVSNGYVGDARVACFHWKKASIEQKQGTVDRGVEQEEGEQEGRQVAERQVRILRALASTRNSKRVSEGARRVKARNERSLRGKGGTVERNAQLDAASQRSSDIFPLFEAPWELSAWDA